MNFYSKLWFKRWIEFIRNLKSRLFVKMVMKDLCLCSEIPVFLDSFTPEQIDFLSYRVVDSYNYAVEIMTREGILENLVSVCIAPETYQDCSEVQAVEFLNYIMNLFNERNVNYEWGEYNVLSIFSK